MSERRIIHLRVSCMVQGTSQVECKCKGLGVPKITYAFRGVRDIDESFVSEVSFGLHHDLTALASETRDPFPLFHSLEHHVCAEHL